MGPSTKALEAIGVLLKGDAMVNETRLAIEGATAAEAGCGSSPTELRGLREKVEAFGRNIQVVSAALTEAGAELARQQKLAAAAGKGNGAAAAAGCSRERRHDHRRSPLPVHRARNERVGNAHIGGRAMRKRCNYKYEQKLPAADGGTPRHVWGNAAC